MTSINQVGIDLRDVGIHKQVRLINKDYSEVIICPDLAGKVMAIGHESSNLFFSEQALRNPDPSKPYQPVGGMRWWPSPEAGFCFPPGTTEFTMAHWRVPESFDKAQFFIDEQTREEALLISRMQLTNVKGNRFDLEVRLKYSLLSAPKVLADGIPDYIRLKEDFRYTGLSQTVTFKNIGDKTWNEQYGMIAPWILCMLQSPLNSVQSPWIVLPIKYGTADKVVDYYRSGKTKDQPVDAGRFLERDSYALFNADGRYCGKKGILPENCLQHEQSPTPFWNSIASVDPEQGIITVMQAAVRPHYEYIDNRLNPAGLYGGTVFDCFVDSGEIAGAGAYSMHEIEAVSPAKIIGPGQELSFMVMLHHIEVAPQEKKLMYALLSRMSGVNLSKETFR